MKHYTALSLLFTTIILSSIVACAVGYVTAGPSSYSYSYDENYFNNINGQQDSVHSGYRTKTAGF
jgi:hypothetical protein